MHTSIVRLADCINRQYQSSTGTEPMTDTLAALALAMADTLDDPHERATFLDIASMGGLRIDHDTPTATVVDELYVNDERTVLFRRWSTGEAEVATREPGATWGPPVYLKPEKP